MTRMILQTTADYKRRRRLAVIRRVASTINAFTDGMVIGFYAGATVLILYTIYFQHPVIQLTVK